MSRSTGWLRDQRALFTEVWDGDSGDYAQAFYRRRPDSQKYLFYWGVQSAVIGAPVVAVVLGVNGMEQRWTAVVVGVCLVMPNVMSMVVAGVEPLVLRRHRRALRRFAGAALPPLSARQWHRVWRRSVDVGRRRRRRLRWVVALCAVAAVVELSGYPGLVGLDLPWLPYVAVAVCLVVVVRALRRPSAEPAVDVELVRATASRHRFDAVSGAEARFGGVELAAVDLDVLERVGLGPDGPVVPPAVTAEERDDDATEGSTPDVVPKVVTMRLWLAFDDRPQWMVCVGDRIVAPLGLWV